MTIHVGTIGKNIQSSIAVLENFINEIKKVFPDSKFYIYENNSTDNTKQLLQKLHGQNIQIKMEDIPVEQQLNNGFARTFDNKPCRMELIAAARNKLMEMIEGETFSENDLVLFFDSDMIKLPPMNVLTNILSNFPKDADVIFANGLNKRNTYYDKYALLYPQRPLGPEILGDEFWKKMPQIIEFKHRQAVYSAFGGLAIYHANQIRGLRYSAIPTRELDEYNLSNAAKSRFKQPRVVTHHNGILLGVYLFGTNTFFYYNNSGYNYPIVCEHSTFHAALWKRGFGRFYIEPTLIYYSSH